jgi:nicotinamidase-related amidase
MRTDGEFRDVVPEVAGLDVATTALVVIDVTNFDAHPDHGFARVMTEEGVDLSYYWDRVEHLLVPNVKRLLDAFRRGGGRVLFARAGAQFSDFADTLVHLRQLQKRAGTLRGTEEFEVRDEILPQLGEAVVDKPGLSAFTTGNADSILRGAGVKTIVLCGVVTNGCVIASGLTAWDCGYSVHVVEDACAADSQAIHDSSIDVMRWLGMPIVSTDAVLQQLRQPDLAHAAS